MKETPKNLSMKENNKDTIASQHENTLFQFDLRKWENDFFYQFPVKSFNKDSIDQLLKRTPFTISDTITSNVKPIIGVLHQQIEHDSILEEWDYSIHEGTGYLYSIQERKSHIGITICQMNGAWVDQIKYLSFSHKGNKIDEIILAANGGDGGFHSNGYGKFVNDSTYIYHFVETEMNFETNEKIIIEEYTKKIIIHPSGRIQSKIIK